MRVNELDCENILVMMESTYLPSICHSGAWYTLATSCHSSICVVDAIILRLQTSYHYNGLDEQGDKAWHISMRLLF